MLWVRPEREQPCFARRHLEQQREQRAVRQSQQQHTVQRQQQYWVPVCEGDSGGGGLQSLSASSGRSARVQGLPQCPERKPTGRSLFPAEFWRGTKTDGEQGLVAGATGAVNVPVPGSGWEGRVRVCIQLRFEVPPPGGRLLEPPKGGTTNLRPRRSIASSINALRAGLLVAIVFMAGLMPAVAGIGEGESSEFGLDLRMGRGTVGVGIGEAVQDSAFTLDLRGVSGPSLFGRSAESGLFMVNLLGAQGGLTVAGRVSDSGSGAVVAGALVTLGTQSTPSDGLGNYGFSSVAVGTYTLTASKSGYNSYNGSVSVSGGASIRRDVSLTSVATSGEPRVTGITCPYPGFLHFLDGPSFSVPFTVTVDWAGHPPAKVEFRTPHGVYEVAASGTTGRRTFNMGSDFGAKGKLRVVAVSSDGTRSAERLADMVVMPPPLGALGSIGMAVSYNLSGSGYKYGSDLGFDMSFFEEAIGAGVIPESIPVFGKAGVNLQFIPEMSCEISSAGVAEFKLKWSDFQTGELMDKEWGRDHNLKKIIELLEDRTAKGLVDRRRLPKAGIGGMEFHWYPIAGGQLKFNRTAEQWERVEFGAGLAGAFEMTKSWPFVVMVGPVPVPMYAKVKLELEAEAQLQVFSVEPPSLNGAIELAPEVRGSLGAGVDQVLAIEGWIGGGLNLDLQYPAEPSLMATVHLNGGVTVYAFLWSWENELLHWQWPQSAAQGMRLFSPLEMTVRAPAPVARGYISRPDYGVFHASPVAEVAARSLAGAAAKPPVMRPKSGPLQTVIFPHSEPDCSSSGTNFHLVWLYDQPSRGTNNRTMTVFSRYNGKEWTTPVPVADDGTADFHPQVLAFADGWSVCAWENERVALPDTVPFEGMTTNLEVAAAWYNGGTATWLPMHSLTTNNWLDRSPKLAGISRSNVLMIWTENTASHLTGNATATNNLWFTRWGGTDWAKPEQFATLTNALVKYDLGYDGTNGNLVMSLDLNNNATNVTGRELFRIAYQGGSWGAPERLTWDDLPDENPLLARDQNGNDVLVWLKGDEFSSVVGFAMTNRQVVQTNLYTSNLGDAKLAQSSDGKLSLMWAEPADYSSDLKAALYDPVFHLWGKPKAMTADPETERSLTTGFWGQNRLVAIYNRVSIGPTNGGAAADLYLMEYNLGEDLALHSIKCSPLNPGPGQTAVLEATVVNLGDKPAANVPVAFYLGLPGAGGVEIGRMTLAQPLAPGDQQDVTYAWTLPQTNQPVAIYAVVDPNQVIADLVRSNNILGVELNKADAAIQSVTWSQIASNLLSVTARIANQGVIANPFAGVEFRLGSTNGTLLYSQSITNLASGQSLEVSFLWDATGAASNTRIFVVLTGLSGANDFDSGNNTFGLVVEQVAAQGNLALSAPLALPGGGYQISVLSEPGRSYRVEASTNLLDWERIVGFYSTNAVMPVLDPGATNWPVRFYRAVLE